MKKMSHIHMPKRHSGGQIVFGAVGDICLRRGVAKGIAKWGMDWPFDEMRSELSRADILFGNMECVLVPAESLPDHINSSELICPFPGEDCASALAHAGFNFLNLAANHVLDAGTAGMHYTKKTLESAGIATGGVGNTQKEARTPVILVVAGLRIGILCYCEDNNYTLGT
ncbi:MAG: CapA family protein, partial [Gammaproteobacteria bacterium]|nr:CapA family protein [Gammaproteobacteria bacterium]